LLAVNAKEIMNDKREEEYVRNVEEQVSKISGQI
jgi:hypothetical protein